MDQFVVMEFNLACGTVHVAVLSFIHLCFVALGLTVQFSVVFLCGIKIWFYVRVFFAVVCSFHPEPMRRLYFVV